MGVLDGKSAIVTGSARGIGRATAELLVSQGAQCLINDLDGDVAEQASGEIAGETAVFAGDLMHSPLQTHYPELSAKFDIDQAEAAATVQQVIQAIASFSEGHEPPTALALVGQQPSDTTQQLAIAHT